MKKLTLNQFIIRANSVHDNFYDYSNAIYINQDTKIKVICPTHGEFEQRPDHHLKGHECKLCSTKKNSNAIMQKMANLFIKKAIKKCGNIYDYSKVKYVSAKEKVIIICPIHGEFLQTPDSHLHNHKCIKCSITENADNQRKTTDEFIKDAKLIHGNLYDYTKVNYKGNKVKVEICCKEHGYFTQIPHNHLYGKGCNLCGNISTKERVIANILTDKNIQFIREKTFNGCINPETNYKLRFDFYLPKYNTCIEYDGKQHFEPQPLWGGEKSLLTSKYRDSIKTDFCKLKNIKLIRINYKENLIRKLNNFCSKVIS